MFSCYILICLLGLCVGNLSLYQLYLQQQSDGLRKSILLDLSCRPRVECKGRESHFLSMHGHRDDARVICHHFRAHATGPQWTFPGSQPSDTESENTLTTLPGLILRLGIQQCQAFIYVLYTSGGTL